MLHLSATFLDPTLKLFTFVRSTADREGFLVQVKESLIILAKETDQTIESLYISTEGVDITRTNHDFDHSKLICNHKRRPNMIHSLGFKPTIQRHSQQQIKLPTLIR